MSDETTELHAICDEIQAEHDHDIAMTLEEKPRDRTEERLLNACNQATQDYVTQIERERDEKISLLETAFERCRELEAERDELKAFSELLETAAHDKLGVTLFGVDYVTEEFMLHVRDTLTAERDESQRELDIANAKLAEYADRIRELMEVKEDGGLIADVLAPICVDEKERMAFERGRVHERLAQQIFKEATS